MDRRRIVASMAVAAAACAGSTAPPAAAEPVEHCTESDARTLFQAFYVAAFRSEGLDGLVDRCSYRLFRDGATYTFSEDDVFLGGVNWTVPLEPGVTRKEAIAEIELNTDRVWIAPVLPDGTLGELVEQEVHVAAPKNAKHPTLGKVVYRQSAFWTELPAGTYVSVYENEYMGELSIAEVTLVITPAG